MKLKVTSFPVELSDAVKRVKKMYPSRFAATGTPVTFEFDTAMKPGANKVAVSAKNGIKVVSGGISGAMRAFGRIMGAAVADGKVRGFAESPDFETVGIMPDCSRNAVRNVASLKEYLLKCALMGVNAAMLYTEDTYEVPGEPYLGYLRGRYTQAELRELDDYAAAIGVEMFPCIQTLGHMEQFLKWPVNFKYRDTGNVLCVGDEDVYAFIKRCIEAVSSCFRSRRIHLGMDEAWGLGTGEFKKKFGEVDHSKIMTDHLGRVETICNELGLKPMIWGDMFFALANKGGSWYEADGKLPAEVVEAIPENLDLVYWDYYHLDVKDYEKFIKIYSAMGKRPVFAGGVWTWGRLWCGLDYSIRSTNAAMTACRAGGVKDTFMTMWGDDGAECDLDSALPGIQHFAELAYSNKNRVDAKLRAKNLIGSCGMIFDDWMESTKIDRNKYFDDGRGGPSSASRALLWEDPVLTIYDGITSKKRGLSKFYLDLSKRIFDASKKSREAKLLVRPAQIARIIGLKLGMRTRLHEAVLKGDRDAVAKILKNEVLPLKKEYEKLREEHRARWMATNSPFGWEVIDTRYSGHIGRFDTLAMRLEDYVEGRIDSLPELEADTLNPWGDNKRAVPSGGYAQGKTPSCIK